MIFFRFLYLNIYAFLLLGLGIGFFLLPMDIFMLILKYIFVLYFLASGIYLLSLWNAKNKRMKVLFCRNLKEIRPATFNNGVWKTLCGQLMVNLVLRDLRKTEKYASLPMAEWKEMKRKAFGRKLKTARKNRNTVGVSAKQSHE